ncbi:hypothetical protein HNP84_003245 [Thermocatellispora tengchongensis]|uniref:DUF5624 domain-containing protein n=1 Tax=Thermocatellispora tengchongensis TaxID=1073253 RepID=A0A840P3F9_9ACTN|nr:DUF5624 domain-containing protein [Thermocatellispora tengchongensis]MBB5133519.1 hypothetical protein [Thermocatellispora tengchongensis]
MVPYESPELVRLFTAYTAGPGSIGRRLAGAVADRGRDDPLIAATATDIALFPGGGRPPEVEGFRISTRGFKELSAVSHLGPAVASLVGLRTLLGDGSWQADAERLLIEVKAARAANSARLWRDTIAVEAYRGREQEIADMIDYSCAVTTRYLTAALADESYLTPETLRADYLAGGGDAELPVPLNHMMVATFFLVSMDIGFRLTRWFTERDIDWERAMVLIAGRQGRPTAGVTWDTSSVATMIMAISGGRLPLERMYLAPHAPTFATPAGGDLGEVAALEEPLRELWGGIRATAELAPVMFDGYPRYALAAPARPDVTDPAVTQVAGMPRIGSVRDMRAMVTRMRVVLEDPRQLLSSCVTDFAMASLAAAGNDPAKVAVPGLTGVRYPTGL